MIKVVFKVGFYTMLLFGFLNAETNNTQNIVDIVDYRFNSIRDNINGDIDNIKTQLLKIKEVQDKTIAKEISNIDRSVKSLEKQLSETKDFEKEFEGSVDKYNEIVISQDKKIQTLNSSLNIWLVSILLIALFTAILSFIFIRIYSRKAKENAVKEVNGILNQWMIQKDEEIEEKEVLEDQIEYWQARYEELKSDDKKLLDEFKTWSKNIEDKELKTRIKKYIKKFQKEKRLKKDK